MKINTHNKYAVMLGLISAGLVLTSAHAQTEQTAPKASIESIDPFLKEDGGATKSDHLGPGSTTLAEMDLFQAARAKMFLERADAVEAEGKTEDARVIRQHVRESAETFKAFRSRAEKEGMSPEQIVLEVEKQYTSDYYKKMARVMIACGEIEAANDMMAFANSMAIYEKSAQRIDEQARILFERGKKEEAVAMQGKAIEKAEADIDRYSKNLDKYKGIDSVSKLSLEQLEKKLSSIIIPRISFQEISIPDAASFIRQRAIELDVAEKDDVKKGFNLVLSDIRSRSDSGPLLIEELHLRNVSVGRALVYICKATGMSMKVGPNAVTLGYDAAPFDGDRVAELYFSEGSAIRGAMITPKRPPVREEDPTRLEIIGASASSLDALARNLFERGNVEDAIEVQHAALLMAKQDLMRYAQTLNKYKGEKFDHALAVNKLRDILIPNVSFENARLNDVVEFIRTSAVELDVKEKDPNLKGLNLVLVSPLATGSIPVLDESALEDWRNDVHPWPVIRELKLRNVTLEVLLNQVCELSEYVMEIEPDGVILRPSL